MSGEKLAIIGLPALALIMLVVGFVAAPAADVDPEIDADQPFDKELAAAYVQAGHTLDADALLALSTLDPDTQAQVEATFERLGPQQLTPVFEALNGTVAYEELHLLRLVYLCRTRSIAS